MKNLKIYMIYTFCTAIALAASAESVISNVVVNQRWPWSEKVDVDFILSGETNDVEVTATWDAHPAPYRLGTLFAAAPGHNRLTWDPSKSPFAGQTLTGFTVAVSNVAASAHTYLIADLVNGGYEFMVAPPAGGCRRKWSSAVSRQERTRSASRLRRSRTYSTTIQVRSPRPTATAGR